MRWIRHGKLLFVKWKDTQKVTLSSRIHQAFSGKTVHRRRVKQAGEWEYRAIPVPNTVVDYNQNMGSVALSDAVLLQHAPQNDEVVQFLFCYFIDIALVNGFILHKQLWERRVETSGSRPITQKKFREKLAAEMLRNSTTTTTPSLTNCPSHTRVLQQ